MTYSSEKQTMGTAVNFISRVSELSVKTQASNTTYLEQYFPDHSECVNVSWSVLETCYSETGLVSMATRKKVEHVIYAWVISPLIMVGIVLNIVNMAVFFKQGLDDRVQLSLFCLAIADLLTLTSMCVRYLYRILPYVLTESWGHSVWLPIMIKYRFLSLHAGFQLVSNYICIVIAVDRCVCVVWPLRAARGLSTSATRKVIGIPSVVILAGRTLVAFKYELKCAVVPGIKMLPLQMAFPSDLYKNFPLVLDILDSFILTTLVPTLSVLITTITTVITVVKLREAAVWRDSKTTGDGVSRINQKEKALTSMLAAISCLFIVCVSPRVVRSLCRFFIPEFRAWGKLCAVMLFTESLINVPLTFNSAVNFFIYFAMGSRFRQTLRQMFVCGARVSSKTGNKPKTSQSH